MSVLLWLAAFGVCFVGGAAAIPVYVYVAGAPVGGSLLGTLMFTLGQLGHSGTLIRYDGSGDVRLLPFDADAGQVYEPRDDAWYEIDGEVTTYRFGWAPVAFDAAAERAAPESTHVDPDSAAVPDGGAQLLDETRNGTPLFSDADPSRPVIHYPRYLELQGREGNKMLARAKENALEEFGGDDETSELMLMILLLVGFVVMFGLTFGMLLVM